uniref:Opsin 3 n=1 Tax=Labrus bergylta TaxID=56723 RepID=A0A3Q3GL20_9LABR
MNPANESRVGRSVDSDHHLFAAGTYKLLALTIGTIGVFGFCNNVVVIILYCKFKRLRTPTNLLLVNISVSDLLVSVIGINFTFAACVQGGWKWSPATCVWDGFSNSLFGIVSIMTLAALAYERYIRVVHAQVVDFPWAWRAMAHIWLYSLAWTGAPLLGWNRYKLEIHRLGCSLDWASKDPNDASFILLFLLACFFVPVGIMIYCYGNILYTVQMFGEATIIPSTTAFHSGPADGPDHQDPAVREEDSCHVFPDDLLLSGVLDALCCRLHDGGLRQEEHGLSHPGHHPLFLCQVQHVLQPAHLRVHEQKVPPLLVTAALLAVLLVAAQPQRAPPSSCRASHPTHRGVEAVRQQGPTQKEGDFQLLLHRLHHHQP